MNGVSVSPPAAHQSAEIVTINADATVAAATVKMRNSRVACLVVTDEREKLVGIVTGQDIVSRVVASSVDPDRTSIAEIMTTNVVSCRRYTSVSKAQQIMTANRIRHLPVVDDGKAVGMISSRDVMVQQLLGDRSTAEQVTKLSTCLKSLDFDEVIETVTQEVPKLFCAERCVLCLSEGASSAAPGPVIKRQECPCPETCLAARDDVAEPFAEQGFHYGKVPSECERLGGQSPSVVIPLTVSTSQGASAEDGEGYSGYLCMCSL
ncbi:unnamed protein product, partial [marine sediment metagenome]